MTTVSKQDHGLHRYAVGCVNAQALAHSICAFTVNAQALAHQCARIDQSDLFALVDQCASFAHSIDPQSLWQTVGGNAHQCAPPYKGCACALPTMPARWQGKANR